MFGAFIVIPAKAGIHAAVVMGPGLRRGDDGLLPRLQLIASVCKMWSGRGVLRSGRIALALGATIIVVAVTLLFTGSVVFFDPNREIVSAQIVDGFGRRQNLMNVGFAYHYFGRS